MRRRSTEQIEFHKKKHTETCISIITMPAETLVQSTARSTKNAFTGCFGFLQKTDELAKITIKESQIAGRKKAFGVEYLDLLASGAKPEDLEACVKRAQDDTKKIMDEIAELEKEIARVDEETKKKIISRPVSAAATTTAAAAPPEAPAPAPVAATPEPEPAPAASAPEPAPAPVAAETPSAPVDAAPPAPAPAVAETPASS